MITKSIKKRIESKRAALISVALAGGLMLLTMIVQCFPAVQNFLQFDRAAICSGQVWRILTCHLVHWGWPHLAGDISALVALLWLIRDEIRIRKLLFMLSSLSLFVGLAVLSGAGEIDLYRGMSGINHGLLGYVLLSKISKTKSRAWWLWTSALLLIIVKVALEFTNTLTIGTGLPAGVTTVALSHATGLAMGIVMFVCRWNKFLR